jgi:hypothetical protein
MHKQFDARTAKVSLDVYVGERMRSAHFNLRLSATTAMKYPQTGNVLGVPTQRQRSFLAVLSVICTMLRVSFQIRRFGSQQVITQLLLNIQAK